MQSPRSTKPAYVLVAVLAAIPLCFASLLAVGAGKSPTGGQGTSVANSQPSAPRPQAPGNALLFPGTKPSYRRSAFPADVPLPSAAEDAVFSVVDSGATAWFRLASTSADLWSFYSEWAKRDGFVAVDPVVASPFRLWRKGRKLVRVDTLPVLEDGALEVIVQVFAAAEEKSK